MPNNQRLRIATRIHFALLRLFDENVEVAELLNGGNEAQEALWVCEASGNTELMRLAREFRAPAVEPAPASDSGWAHSTGFGTTGFGQTGFGTTYGELAPQAPAPRPSMFGRLGLRPLR